MVDSNNIAIIRQNLIELKRQINDLDVEIPSHAAADVGKTLTVDSEGDLEWSLPVPEHDSGDSGKILAVDASGDLEWKDEYSYTPPAYSSTEEVNTGKKWIDGKDIYCKYFTGDNLDNTTPIQINVSSLNVDTVINFENRVFNANRVVVPSAYRTEKYFFNCVYSKANNNLSITTGSAFNGDSYTIVVYYTKAPETREDQDPEPETKSRKKSNK